MVNIRIFADQDTGIDKILAYIEKVDKRGIHVQQLNPAQWVPKDDSSHYVNIHVSIPCRLALNSPGFNILAASQPYPAEWAWVEDRMDLLICSWESSKPTLPPGKSFREAVETWRRAIVKATKAPKQIPVPVNQVPVSVVTVSHYGPAWFTNMVQNVLGQEWPAVEWIIVGDLKTQVDKLKQDNPKINVICIDGNLESGIQAASHDVVVIMDDDVHYPASSISKRVEGLQRSGADLVYCATLPVYDVRHYMSSMCVPDLRKLPHLRAFESSFAFKKIFWNGGGPIQTREMQTAELSPLGLLVALVHKANPDVRYAEEPEAGVEPNGCHYGFSEKYFQYIHGIGMAAKME